MGFAYDSPYYDRSDPDETLSDTYPIRSDLIMLNGQRSNFWVSVELG